MNLITWGGETGRLRPFPAKREVEAARVIQRLAPLGLAHAIVVEGHP